MANHSDTHPNIPVTHEAVTTFLDGCNCAQSVITVYAERYGIDEALAIRIASGFGGELGRMGGVCGTLTGAVLVLGLELGPRTRVGRNVRVDLHSYMQVAGGLYKTTRQ
jgi:C_GCAxxG_C_C family probable redox protein